MTSDELILALVSLVRVTHPSMLRQEADGFTVDFESLVLKKALDPDEQLLLKMRAVMELPNQDVAIEIDLEPAERQRLAVTLTGLEGLQQWPVDVLKMSRSLRTKLLAVSDTADA